MIASESNFKPLRALVLVRRDEPESDADGIIIPDNVKTYGWRATVVRSGPDAASYAEGDAILFLKEYTVLPFKDRGLALTDAKHILAKLQVKRRAELIIPQNRFVLIEPYDLPAEIEGVYIPQKHGRRQRTGQVMRVGSDCREVKPSYDVWFESERGVNCVEDGFDYKLIDEADILAMRDGGAQ
jgi:co-chaperonin GroES (HSP10)